MVDLDQGVVSLALEVLVPLVELLCKVDLPGPVVDEVEVLVAEPTGFGLRPDDEVVKAFLEEPLGLLVFEDDSALLDLVQLDHVAWRVRKLVLVFIGYQHSFDWVHVQVPSVSLQASSMHLPDASLDTLHREEALVRFFVLDVCLYLFDDVIQLRIVQQV